MCTIPCTVFNAWQVGTTINALLHNHRIRGIVLVDQCHALKVVDGFNV